MTELAVLDFETTGLVPGHDEVLQVAVVDGTGAVLMNEYCCPQRHTAWADAQRVNGIAPQEVCGKPPFEALVPRLQEILSGARQVVAYNDGFEKAFLDAYGIPSRGLHWGEDPMAAFARQMGGQKRSLSAVASFFDYEFAAHDALADVRATLYAYERLADGGLLRWAARNASPAWGQSTRGPVAYQTLPPQDMLRLLKCLGLCPLTAAEPRQLWYKGIYTASPRPCTAVGFQNRSKEDGWLVVAVEAGGVTYLVCDDYLREMQSPAFGREGAAAPAAGQGAGIKRAGRAAPAAASAPGKAGGAANSRYAAFARKSAALKNVETNPDADPENPFYGRAVVFTGDMEMPRAEAAQAVAELGAQVKSAVSRKTDYLVVGAQDPALVGAGGRSGKEEKAEALNEAGGGHIEILDEAAFRALLARARGREAAE